jgi:hypothetical protein
VRAAARIGVLVQRRAVEARQREVVAREVRRHPVEDHADAVLVHAVDERAEVVGRAVARRGREVARDLVAPGAGERVRHHGHQLDVRVAHVARVGRELVGQLEVAQRPVALQRVQPPRAEMDLVDRYRPPQRLGRLALREPSVVAPGVPRPVHDRRGLRRLLGGERVRIGLQADLAVLGEDLELVVVALPDVRQEQLPDAGRAERAHRVQPPVPGVEVPDDGDGACARRPDRERRAGDALGLAHVRAEPGVELLVAALAGQVQVELAERRQERVGIVDRERPRLAVVDLELVAQRQLAPVDHALEDAPGVHLLECYRLALLGQRGDGGRGRPKRAHDDAAVVRVRAEDGVRVRVLAADDAVEFGGGGDGHMGWPSLSRKRATVGSRPPGSRPSRDGC